MEYEKLIEDLFKAYYQARKNKRKKQSVMAFEIDYEPKLFKLGRELAEGNYKIGKSICFISFKPVQREIFAADFRDRIVHHLVFNYIKLIFENSFINDSYSCRPRKGTLYGIKRLDHFIRSCSQNYKKDCHILKLDIQGYFMSIDRNILFNQIEEKIKNYKGHRKFSTTWILKLIHQIIFHDPTKNCLINGKKSDWSGLPKSKSLFGAEKDKGLPIGNLTSQLFGNVYLDGFDHFVKYNLSCKYYGRYVDDIVIVHPDRKYLKSMIPIIRIFLRQNLKLDLHPKKIYLQSYKNGVSFLGTFLKPHRIYVRNRVKGNFYKNIEHWDNVINTDKKCLARYPDYNIYRQEKLNIQKMIASINSYLGIMSLFHTYRCRRKILTRHVLTNFNKYIYTEGNYHKIVMK